MDSYTVTFARSARKELENLPAREGNRIFSKIESLSHLPRPQGCIKLTGESGLWRIRVGVYRVVYAIDDDALSIDIVAVRHRRDVYR
ncbi:MAG TPA: type II toxin-antitoxin system RelE/ParE family toxin [Caldilineaceae bacterium]|nr:type II toxin-antitoxin system RelE/ParE family toxin [Caldilineaceae bacterium]